ncbi:MAG: flagellar basal-body rod protein FlgF [Thermotogaceae bacterium]|nr:flagellar basal-body rod protein FlgF [Thermotogaceae bacterium]
MIRGMYISTMGMLNDMYKLDLISNNLSNVDTVGYKKDVAAFKTYMDRMMFSNASDNPFNNLHPIGVLEGAVVLDEVKPVITQGPLEYTGNPYDIAINGEGFFVVDRNGATLYTRAGNFKRNAEGFLVTGRGDFVLSENGNKIKIPNDAYISEDGTIYDSSNEKIARIATVVFKNPNKLKKVGYNYFRETDESGKASFAKLGLKVGYIEKSNVNALREMVNMIKALRHFEIAQRSITTSDELLGRLFNSVGTLR